MHSAVRLQPDQLGNSVFLKLLAVFEKRKERLKRGATRWIEARKIRKRTDKASERNG